MDYKDQIIKENTLKLREMINKLPSYSNLFFRGIEQSTSSRTRIAYAYDLNVFFKYLVSDYGPFKDRDIKSITLSELENLHVYDLEGFSEYLTLYSQDENSERINKELGIKRKLCCVKSFYKFYYKKEEIKSNPAELMVLPKIHEKEIIRLDPGEVAELLDNVEDGIGLTDRQKKIQKKTKNRDLALLTLLLGTGIRVSECVGLNIMDFDLREGCIHIWRKGGKAANVYFGNEVESAMNAYLDEREKITPLPGHEDALFLSLQNKRMGVRAIEMLVKKYTDVMSLSKHITPHKLRSTYGTSLYQATGDIYLVADVLGHTDVNTTRKHYAAIEQDQHRLARNKVILRDDTDKKGTEDN